MTEIILHEPSAKWVENFQAFMQAVQANSDGLFLTVEHIGSTSIPDMPAKDIVDVQCAVKNFDGLAEIRHVLEKMGFQYVEDLQQDHVPFQPGDVVEAGWEKRFFKGELGGQAFNVHIRQLDGKNWRFALMFRDSLRKSKKLRTAYQQCKERLVQADVSLAHYCSVKDSIIDLMSLQFEE